MRPALLDPLPFATSDRLASPLQRLDFSRIRNRYVRAPWRPSNAEVTIASAPKKRISSGAIIGTLRVQDITREKRPDDYQCGGPGGVVSVGSSTAFVIPRSAAVEGSRRVNAMSNFDALIQDLVIANRILTREEVVDAYGHVSVRHPDNPNRFLIARSLARSWWAPKTSSGST